MASSGPTSTPSIHTTHAHNTHTHDTQCTSSEAQVALFASGFKYSNTVWCQLMIRVFKYHYDVTLK